MPRLESNEEKAFVKWTKKKGYLCKKMKTDDARGWPDRMLVVNGRIFFIEFKQPGKKPTKYQKQIHNELRKRGRAVYIAYSNEHAQEITLNEIQAT